MPERDDTETQKDTELQAQIKEDIESIREDGYDVFLLVKIAQRMDQLIGAMNAVINNQRLIVELLAIEDEQFVSEEHLPDKDDTIQ